MSVFKEFTLSNNRFKIGAQLSVGDWDKVLNHLNKASCNGVFYLRQQGVANGGELHYCVIKMGNSSASAVVLRR